MVFLDVNALMDSAFRHRPRQAKIKQFIAQLDPEDRLAISLLSVHILMYFGRKEGVPDDRLRALIDQAILLDLTADDYDWAVANEQGSDFEDALQLAVALRNGCDRFVTFNGKLARAYAYLPLTIIIPI